MFPKDGSDIGIINGEKIGSHDNGSKFTKRSKPQQIKNQEDRSLGFFI